MKLLDKSVNSLSQRLDKHYPGTSNNYSDGISYWKGRKIIPLDKWLKITKANTISSRENYNVKEGLQYFPDGYFDWMFPLGIPEDLKAEGNTWYSHYIELMEYRKDPRIGRTKCFGCLLSPSREESALFLGINKVMARSIEHENNNSSTIYPCPVLNRYECPYERDKIKQQRDGTKSTIDINQLFQLSEIAFLVELALAKAQDDTSKVPIKNRENVYHALTDRETLDAILEQGLGEDKQKYKNQIIEFFMSIKYKIRIEDLTFYR